MVYWNTFCSGYIRVNEMQYQYIKIDTVDYGYTHNYNSKNTDHMSK